MNERELALLHLERELAVLVRRARRVVRERSTEVHPDLHPGAYLILGHLRHNGAMRASALSDAFDLDKAAVSRQLRDLGRLGLIERTPDPEDGRATQVALTDDAERRLADVSVQRRKGVDERLGDWTTAEMEEFAGWLVRYNEALDDPENA